MRFPQKPTALRCPIEHVQPCSGCRDEYGQALPQRHRFEVMGLLGRDRCPSHRVLLEPIR